ncbi:MAG: hypothetical protein KGI45_00625 [Patescibacteria group bacterium]|nr:hypothetical protein [Patescibacteria group bacterium]MDE1966568.1 hypothetical protein [Patescibacteria group bacterium]
MKKINVSLTFIISALMAFTYAIVPGTTIISELSNLYWIPAFSEYILGRVSGNDGLGVGILYEFLGPVLVFISWLVAIYIVQYLYIKFVRKQKPVIRLPDQKVSRALVVTIVICTLLVVVMNVIFVKSLPH